MNNPNKLGGLVLQTRFYHICVMAIAACFAFFPQAQAGEESSPAPGRAMARQAGILSGDWSTADHSEMEKLQQTFESGPEITEACLSCHAKADDQLFHTIHWKWLSPYEDGDLIGKAGYSINNFCISTNKMEDQKCSSCHIGWNGKEDGINCLRCHGGADMDWQAQFKDYKFFKEMGETELVEEIQADIKEAVTDITRPTRQNCGSCHFNGGGGEAVKHGDLDASLIKPKRSLDVHMGIDGQDFSCTRCHTTQEHQVSGRVYSTPAVSERKSLVEDDLAPKISCESCHTATPHKDDKINDHTDMVACQSCHIPEFARAHATEMTWDWSKAGRLKEGKPYIEKGKYDRPVYKSIKGTFTWEKDVVPKYYWYNGSVAAVTAKDVIDPSKTVRLSHPVGERGEGQSRIFPFKVHWAKQPYDKVNNTLVTPLLSKKNNGYWKTFDWQDSISRGMDIMDLPWSGELGFVETTYVFPTTHMVAPKEQALDCRACHRLKSGRLENLAGFYMPGRDRFQLLDYGAWGLAIAALAAVLLHAIGRIMASPGKKEE
ncbi:MAG: tetrathionate reductase family octaheme c-type cytochrome [Desulfobacterales bacterium]|nr:tetrathionate reductase family octaheme c-type cytochrome [Desulfobacterales bacterium]